MSQQAQQQQTATTHFDAAKVIVETLKGLDKSAQALAMRFASETLGIQAPAPAQSPGHTPAPLGGGGSPSPSGGATQSTNIKQFTAAKAPKSDQQFAAVVAYFYRFEAPPAQRKETIDAATLQEAARLAGRRRPKKPAMTLTNAKNAGYLDMAGSGNYSLSTVGENLVAMTLPGNGGEGSSGRGGAKKKVAKKKARANKGGKSTG